MPKPSAATEPVTFSDEAGTVATSSNIASAAPAFSWDLGKITAGLLLLGLIGFALIWQKKQAGRQISANALHTLGKIQLTPNQHVHLIGCGPDALLVGTNNTQITLLHKMPLNNLKSVDKSVAPVIQAPQYSIPGSTLRDHADFGIMLQQQNLTNQVQQETPQN